MLRFYYALASKLRPLQLLWVVLALASLGWLGYLLLLAPVAISQRWQLTALVSFALLLNIILLILLFGQSPPQAVATDCWGKLHSRLRDMMQYCLASLLTVLFLVILWLLLKIALGIILPLMF